MSDLIRKQLYITRSQDKLLKKKAAELDVSEAELVREAIDNQANKIEHPRRDVEKWREESRFIKGKMSKNREVYKKRTWKREDLYDR